MRVKHNLKKEELDGLEIEKRNNELLAKEIAKGTRCAGVPHLKSGKKHLSALILILSK